MGAEEVPDCQTLAEPSDEKQLAVDCAKRRKSAEAEDAVEVREIGAIAAAGDLSWDFPLSRTDVARRMALHGDFVRQVACAQSVKTETVAHAARELAAEHTAVCAKLSELQKSLSDTCEDAAASRRQVEWLRRVLEATVGIREAALQSQREGDDPVGEKPEMDSEERKRAEAAEKHAAQAHRQTLLRRARRRQCRLRRAAEEAAKVNAEDAAPAPPRNTGGVQTEARFKTSLSFWSACSANRGASLKEGAGGHAGNSAPHGAGPNGVNGKPSHRGRVLRASPAANRWGCFIDGRFTAARAHEEHHGGRGS